MKVNPNFLILLFPLLVVTAGVAYGLKDKNKSNVGEVKENITTPGGAMDTTDEVKTEISPNQEEVNEFKKEESQIEQNTTVSTNGWTNYTDTTNNIRLKYPNGWSANDSTNIIMVKKIAINSLSAQMEIMSSK